MEDKEFYAQKLAARANACLLALKAIMFTGLGVIAAFVIFSIVAFTCNLSEEGKVIGFAVFGIACIALIACAVTVFAVAKASLSKLKKLG